MSSFIHGFRGLNRDNLYPVLEAYFLGEQKPLVVLVYVRSLLRRSLFVSQGRWGEGGAESYVRRTVAVIFDFITEEGWGKEISTLGVGVRVKEFPPLFDLPQLLSFLEFNIVVACAHVQLRTPRNLKHLQCRLVYLQCRSAFDLPKVLYFFYTRVFVTLGKSTMASSSYHAIYLSRTHKTTPLHHASQIFDHSKSWTAWLLNFRKIELVPSECRIKGTLG